MKILKIMGKVFISLILIFIIGNFLCYLYALITPKISIKNINSFFLYDNNNELVFQGSGTQEWITIDDISQNLINATIAVEDKNFYNHKGFDFLRIGKAAIENIKAGSIVQGASTISQQYAKNLFLTFEKSWKRKWKEMWLTLELETHYTKKEILEGYLNTINYGHGMYGIENAAQYYFNKSASDLTIVEASILAGIPNSPSNYSPLANYKLSKTRQLVVLSRMQQLGYISEEEKNEIYNTELTFYGKVDSLNLTTLMYFQDAVMDELKSIDKIPSSYLETGGLKIYTTLDINAQTILENNIDKYLQNSLIQTASVIMNSDDGSIVALVGGRNYTESQFNRATSSKRQSGSSIKPFLYYAALENGFTASTTFLSQATTFNLSNGKTYSPKNYNNLYANKSISLATAIAYSDNIYAVKTHLFLDDEALNSVASRVGFDTTIANVPSSALGSTEVNIIEMVKGYATFANEGYKIKAHLISKVEDMNGNTLYEFKNEKSLVLNQSYTFIMSELLSNTYDNNLIDYNYPTCIGIAPRLTRKYAMKSGTTDYDAWLAGYTPNFVMVSWVGYDNNLPVSSSESFANKKIWADTMEKYLNDKEKIWYDMPPNIVGVLVDPISGTLATANSKNKKVLYYLKGTEPSNTISAFDDINQE